MRVLGICATILVGLFTLSIGLIRAQPYEEDTLRTLLNNPQDCAKPCWRGIRPSDTSVDEAIIRLQADPWIDADSIEIDRQQIQWAWSGQQSALINARQPGMMHISNQRVFSITLPLSMGMGDFYLLYGSPFWGSRGRFRYEAFVQYSYPDEYVSLMLRVDCPMRSVSYWHAQPEVTLSRGQLRGARFEPRSNYVKLC